VGGPIIREADNRVIGVVSFGADVETQELPRTAYGAVFAAILGSSIKLPDENRELREYSFQDLADYDLVDTDDVEFRMRRTDEGAMIIWPDEED
jgi:hypothetical protein